MEVLSGKILLVMMVPNKYALEEKQVELLLSQKRK